MRINPIGNSLPPQYKRLDSQATTQQGETSSSTQTPASATSIQLDSIRDLSQVLEQSTEVRESVVEAVKLKLQAGEYLSKQAAVDTARSILDL
jgi:anti-sigma28 factor (negative regulator of flagellin synthesis)